MLSRFRISVAIEAAGLALSDELRAIVAVDADKRTDLQKEYLARYFKLVDPDGLIAEPEYDMGILMREDPRELLHGDAHERASWLAEHTGLDPVAIWEWGVVERVSTGLLCTGVDLQPVGREMLAVADRVADCSRLRRYASVCRSAHERRPERGWTHSDFSRILWLVPRCAAA